MSTDLRDEIHDQLSRRTFLGKAGLGIGAAALSTLLGPDVFGRPQTYSGEKIPLTPKVKRVIYLFQSGAPSQLETFDYKSKLEQMWGQELPESVRNGQRLTGMSSGQRSFPLAASVYKFAQHGKSRAWVSELLPHHSKIVDDLCFIKSMHTEHINHDPAVTFIQTGNQIGGRPSMGSWVTYGLGSENQNLPGFVVLLSRGRGGDQPLYAKLWSNGFLSSVHQGVVFRSGPDPIFYLNNPDGLDGVTRRNMLNSLAKMSADQFNQILDPEINDRIQQYEMAYRMQSSVPTTLDISKEPDYIFDMYGPESRIPGTFAANCLLARKLAEKDVRFIQLYHQGWDQHGNLPDDIKIMAKSVDQPSVALIKDLKQRGLLDDTLIIWGGEFGRTNYSQGKLTRENYGRDHHPRCFTIYLTGGGVKRGYQHGETDEFSYNIVKDPVHVHDLQATVLHLLGIDHEQLTFKFQGRRYRLTDVAGKVVREILT
jgi:Protein of unknown function (DUF1501)